MAHYWLPDATSGTGTGNWSATGATGHWADDAAGTNLGKAAPGSGDDVIFGAAAFNGAGQVVTIDAAASCGSMDWTGATNNPTLSMGTNNILVYGNITLIAAMTATGTSGLLNVKANSTITSNGLTNSMRWYVGTAGITATLADAFVTTNVNTFGFAAGTINTANFGLTAASMTISGADAKVLTLGSSTVNLSGTTGILYSGSNLTVTANTATINISGTGACALGAADWNGASFNLNGTAHTLSDNFIVNNMRWGRSTGIQTITGTAGMTPVIRHLYANNGRNVLTINSTGAVWTISGNTGYCELDYVNMTNCAVDWKYLYYAGDHSTNGGGNTNWIFSRKVRVWRRIW